MSKNKRAQLRRQKERKRPLEIGGPLLIESWERTVQKLSAYWDPKEAREAILTLSEPERTRLQEQLAYEPKWGNPKR